MMTKLHSFVGKSLERIDETSKDNLVVLESGKSCKIVKTDRQRNRIVPYT